MSHRAGAKRLYSNTTSAVNCGLSKIPAVCPGEAGIATSASGTVPKDFRPKADVPLTSTALEAVRVSEHWQGERTRRRRVPMAASCTPMAQGCRPSFVRRYACA